MRNLVLLLPLVACTSSSPSDVATGELGAWQAALPLPTPRANHCSAVIDDWVLVIGGNYQQDGSFVKTDEIHAAQLGADGTLGPWQLAGRTASPVTECEATSDGHHLYIIDGIYDREEDGRQVWTAELDAHGMIGPLTSLGTLPAIAISTEAAVRNGELLVMNTKVPANDDGQTATLRTKLAPSLTWTTDDLHIGFRGQSEYAFSDQYVYAIGGYRDPAVGALSDVNVAPIGGGAAQATTSLPQPVGFGEAVVVDDWLFVVGGRAQVFGAPGTTQVFAAPLAADGSVGAWTASSLPMARTNHELTLVGDYLVLTGGAVMGPGDANVLVARVRYPQ
jgi:hypothetical protein